jgi:hypothetical protein
MRIQVRRMQHLFALVLASLALTACAAAAPPSSDDAGAAPEPTCEPAPERDPFCASADVAKHAFTCPADLPRFPDGCGDGTPIDGGDVVICCP